MLEFSDIRTKLFGLTFGMLFSAGFGKHYIDDRLIFAAGESVYGGDGNDTTHGNNLIYGGAFNDIIYGVREDDKRYGDSGNRNYSLIAFGEGDEVVIDHSTIDISADGATWIGTLNTTNLAINTKINLKNGTTNTPGESILHIENVISGQGNDSVTGSNANHTLSGGFGNGMLNGGNGNDLLQGEDGTDRLNGGSGNDELRGGAGNGRLEGSVGADVLVGDLGLNTFVLKSAGHSTGSAADLIVAGDGAVAFENAGAAAGDVIDLSGIDADTSIAGNQAFVFGGAGIGRVQVIEELGNSVVLGNTDADAVFEFRLVIQDAGVLASAYTAADFLL